MQHHLGRQSGTPEMLRQALLDQGVKYCLASFVDTHGIPNCKTVPIIHFTKMLNASEMFTGAALEGVPQAVNDDEVCAKPDPGSAIVLPWNAEVAWFASDLYYHGEPFTACRRGILKRALEDRANPHGLSKLGYQFMAGILKHAKPICAVVAPLVNSYKRLVLKGSMSGYTWRLSTCPMVAATPPTCCGSRPREVGLSAGRRTSPVTPTSPRRWC